MKIRQDDWSLNRRGETDRRRHRDKVKELIKENLGDVISDEAIITQSRDKVVKVPIRGVKEYRFRFDDRNQPGAGQGQANGQGRQTHKGDVLGPAPGQGGPPKHPGEAGEMPGTDYYESEITLEELAELVFEDLGLPNLVDKAQQDLVTQDGVSFDEVRRTGIRSNLDKRRSVREAIRRAARERGDDARAGEGEGPGDEAPAAFTGLKREDLRFKSWTEDAQPTTNAVVIAMMDVSGSMDTFKKYIARSFYFWMVRFLRRTYEHVEVVFISHHTEAREVTEHEFFHKGESGGTMVSSAYALALKVIEDRYPTAAWNVYPFHFSDGDNFSSDNADAVALAQRLASTCQLFGYGEIKGLGYYLSANTLKSLLTEEVDSDRFVAVTIASKADVYPALRAFFAPTAEPMPSG